MFDLATIDQRSKTLSDKCLRKPGEPSPATAPEEFVNGDRLERKPKSESSNNIENGDKFEGQTES